MEIRVKVSSSLWRPGGRVGKPEVTFQNCFAGTFSRQPKRDAKSVERNMTADF